MSVEKYILTDGNVVASTGMAAMIAATQFLPALQSPYLKGSAKREIDKERIKKACVDLKELTIELNASVSEVSMFIFNAQLNTLGMGTVVNDSLEIGANTVAFLESEYIEYCHRLENLSGIANRTILNSANSTKELGIALLNDQTELETLLISVIELKNYNGGIKYFGSSFYKTSQLLISFLDNLNNSLEKIGELKK